MKLQGGVFTVSLDFELYWGVRDKRTVEQYHTHISGVRHAVRQMLTAFNDYGIHATWATVGFLFFNDLEHLKRNIPNRVPHYRRAGLSPYIYLARTAALDDACHFAPDLVELIQSHQGQEIGTHTFSHYYCLEPGQSLADFREDCAAAIAIAQSKGIPLASLVFPRNQWNPEYLSVLAKMGVQCYRGNESGWIRQASVGKGPSRLERALRLTDNYVNLFGHNTHELSDCTKQRPFNFTSSRYLRPYSKRAAFLDAMRLRRITRALDDAALNKRIYHLWWHPHNFGVDTDQNIAFLRRIADHFRRLKKRHGMQSLNMGELCRLSETDNATE